jgi:hypothetical protein
MEQVSHYQILKVSLLLAASYLGASTQVVMLLHLMSEQFKE